MRRFLYTLLILALLYAGITYLLSGMVIDPPPRRTTQVSVQRLMDRWQIDLDSIAARLPEREAVHIQSEDGLTLQGYWARTPDTSQASCTVVLAHGYTDNHSGMFKYAQLFDSCFCDLLMIEHRGHGHSQGDFVTGGVLESSDLRRWLAYAQQANHHPPSRIGLVGESWGGAASLQAVSQLDSPLAFLLAESPYADWHTAITERTDRSYGSWLRLFMPGTRFWIKMRTGQSMNEASAKNDASTITTPTILFHSTSDPDTYYEQSRQIYERLPATTPSALHLTEWGSHHVHSIYDRPDEYRELFWDFVREASPDFCP